MNPQTTLMMLQGETSVPIGLLLECDELTQAIRENKSYPELLDIVNENF